MATLTLRKINESDDLIYIQSKSLLSRLHHQQLQHQSLYRM
ncbi:hypothetical protein J659_4197, partial [Acinetobacter baumannii 1406589]